jgi:hypothetical protein
MTDKGAHGLLAAMMEPAASQEEEFNDWYDLEHVPQLLSVAGVLTATRWICVEGWPRYLATYDLEHVDVLTSDAYRQATGGHFTPWSQRILGRVRGWRRIAMAGIDASSGVTDANAEALELLFVDTEANAIRLAAELERVPAILQARAFAIPDEGLAATLVSAGGLAALPLKLGAVQEQPMLRGSARYVRYHRRDPVAAFRAIDRGQAL